MIKTTLLAFMTMALQAATITQTYTYVAPSPWGEGTYMQAPVIRFVGFDPSLGTLTSSSLTGSLTVTVHPPLIPGVAREKAERRGSG